MCRNILLTLNNHPPIIRILINHFLNFCEASEDGQISKFPVPFQLGSLHLTSMITCPYDSGLVPTDCKSSLTLQSSSWRRILLLIVAVTIHNIPEGLAVGVGFGAVGRSKSATFQTARNLALGIGIQNFPEGIAVSLPLKAAGFSNARAIW